MAGMNQLGSAHGVVASTSPATGVVPATFKAPNQT
jgi:hypothetical protein